MLSDISLGYTSLDFLLVVVARRPEVEALGLFLGPAHDRLLLVVLMLLDPAEDGRAALGDARPVQAVDVELLGPRRREADRPVLAGAEVVHEEGEKVILEVGTDQR